MNAISKTATIKYAFKKSLPVFFGYLFLGSAFGIMLYDAGYNWVWAAFISVIVYAGSGQFLLVSLLSSAASIPTVAMMTLFINSSSIFSFINFVFHINHPHTIKGEIYSPLINLFYILS